VITSYEVGTIFKIVDRASPVISELTRMMYRLEETTALTKKNLQSIGSIRFGNLNRGIIGLTEHAARMQAAFGKTFDEIKMGTGASITQAQSLAAEWRNVAAAARSAGIAAGSGTRRASASVTLPGHTPGSSRGGMFGLRTRNHLALPGGTSVGVHGHGMGGQAALAAAGIIGYSVYEEAQIEDIAARALMTGQIKTGAGVKDSEAFKRIREVIRTNTAKTGFSPRQVGDAILSTERQFGGLSFDKRLSLENTILPYAAIEARMKETDLSTAFEAMVGMTHMTGTYDAKKVPELMRQFSYASMVTPASINTFRNALGYSMPILSGGMRMDPGAVMFLTAMTESAGITNSKSGTWIRSFFEKLMPASGMNLTRSAPKHNSALQQMGLLDANGRPSWEVKGVGGKVDWMQSVVKLSQTMNTALGKMDDSTRLSALHQVFGERGGGFGALMNLPEFIAQFPTIVQKMQNWQGGSGGLLEYMAASPVQQGRTAWADLQNVLLDIGQVALPPVLTSLRAFDDLIKNVGGTLGLVLQHLPKQGSFGGIPNQGTLGDAIGKGMAAGGAVGLGVGWFGGPISMGLSGALGAVVGGGAYAGSYLANKYLPGGTGGASAASGTVRTIPIPGGAGSSLGPSTGTFNVPDDDALPPNARPRMYSPASYTTGGGSPGGLSQFASFAPASTSGGMSYMPPSVAGMGVGVRHGGGNISIPTGPAPGGIIGHVKQSQSAGAKRLMADLMARGWSKEAAAVAAGNASVESGFNPSNHSGDGGTSWGLMQWHLDRRSSMVNWAKSHGKNWNDWDSQVGFLDHEWRQRFGKDSVASHDMNRLKYMGKRYEGYSTNSFGTRNALADRFLRLPTNVGESPVTHPPKAEHHAETPVNLHLDGRVVARSTMKHMARMGNGPARAPRMPDYTAATPISV